MCCHSLGIWKLKSPLTSGESGTRTVCYLPGDKKSPEVVQRRLDFWLISDVCQDEVEETNIKTAIGTDHSAITTCISFNSLDEQTRSPSYWKFNSSLVNDENYVSMIDQKIPVSENG